MQYIYIYIYLAGCFHRPPKPSQLLVDGVIMITCVFFISLSLSLSPPPSLTTQFYGCHCVYAFVSLHITVITTVITTPQTRQEAVETLRRPSSKEALARQEALRLQPLPMGRALGCRAPWVLVQWTDRAGPPWLGGKEVLRPLVVHEVCWAMGQWMGMVRVKNFVMGSARTLKVNGVCAAAD